MQLLTDERDAQTFINHVLGLTNWADHLATTLGDETKEFTADDLMYVHFDAHADFLQGFLDRKDFIATFQALHPTLTRLVGAAGEMVDSFRRLHTVRRELILPHLNADRSDVHRHTEAFTAPVSDMSTEQDLAAVNNLTVPQLRSWRAQLNNNGFVHLTKPERAKLRNAIRKEFGLTQ